MKAKTRAEIERIGLDEAKVFARIRSEHLWPMRDVRPNDWNPKQCTDERLLSIAYSLKRHGWLENDLPLLWRKPKSKTLTIIGGEHRWKVCQVAKFEHFPGIIATAIETVEDAMALTMAMEEAKARRDNRRYTENLVALAQSRRDEELREILRIRDPEALRRAAEERRERISAEIRKRQEQEPPRIVSLTMTGPMYVRFNEAMGKARTQLKRSERICDLVESLSDGEIVDLAVVFEQWQRKRDQGSEEIRRSRRDCSNASAADPRSV